MIVAASCSENLNLNKVLVPKSERRSFTFLMEQAQLEYDKGNFALALVHAEKAEKIAPNDEGVVVLLGYIHLAHTGLDSFQIANALLDRASESEPPPSDTQQSSGPVTKIMDMLAKPLRMNREDLFKLGKERDEDELTLFKELPLLIPISADLARRSSVPILQHLNRAISKLCVYMDSELRSPDLDRRHSRTNCGTQSLSSKRQATAKLLWGFLHLVEAAALFPVVQFRNENATTPNIQVRANKLEERQDELSLDSYIEHINSLAAAIDNVYQIEDIHSQFNIMVTDLLTVNRAFSSLLGLPAKFRRTLDKAILSITEELGDENSGTEGIRSQAIAMKKQFNKQTIDNLGNQISKIAKEDPTGFEEKKAELCSAYIKIGGRESELAECHPDN